MKRILEGRNLSGMEILRDGGLNKKKLGGGGMDMFRNYRLMCSKERNSVFPGNSLNNVKADFIVHIML